MKPKFKHDCDDRSCCRFITHRKGKDIYTYNIGQGILVRFGDEPQDNLTYDMEILMKIGALDDWIG